MEERIIGMISFLNSNINNLVGRVTTSTVQGELLRWSGTASACCQLVPDSRCLDIIDRVNAELSLQYMTAPVAERTKSGLESRLSSGINDMLMTPNLA